MDISVIIPVYNVEKYLRECIESVLKQIYKDFEVILIDDGSTDSCPSICDEYSKKDNRVRVFHKDNGGLSDARNVGIENAKGKYLSFVDSDDVVDEDFLSTFVEQAKKENADIVVCNAQPFFNEIGIGKSNEYVKTVYTDYKKFQLILNNTKVNDYYMNKFYKKNLFDNFKLPIGLLWEDVYTMHLLFEKANKVVYVDKKLYNHRYNYEGISHNSKFNDYNFDYIKACKGQFEFFVQKGVFFNESGKKYINSIMGTVDKLYTLLPHYKSHKMVKQIRNIVQNDLLNLLKIDNLSKVERENLELMNKSLTTWIHYLNIHKFFNRFHNRPRIQSMLKKIKLFKSCEIGER